jgi:NAD(P)-dependent dehydrogenase (short-subunit alcohol dehydrogenase family)
MPDLSGKIIVITGAKGGLGTFVTRCFLDAGATVAGVSRSISASDFDHPRFAAIPAELSSRENADAVLQAVVAQFGRVDGLVHLMGGWAGGSRLEDTATATFDRMLELNLRSSFFAMSAAMRSMRAQRAGRLLAVASKAAVEPQVDAGAYSVSKAALVALVHAFAAEARGAGVTANAVLPGTMDTPQNRAANPTADPSRWVQPCQVADLLVHLASDAASNVSGAAIPVYGIDA